MKPMDEPNETETTSRSKPEVRPADADPLPRTAGSSHDARAVCRQRTPTAGVWLEPCVISL